MYYVIISGSGLYWSNGDGWVGDLADATRFSRNDRFTLNLPIGGDWLEIHRTPTSRAGQDKRQRRRHAMLARLAR